MDPYRRSADRPCGTKRRYGSRKLALGAAALSRKESGEPIEAYHCLSTGGRCHAWHIGHPPGWKKQQRQVLPPDRPLRAAIGHGPTLILLTLLRLSALESRGVTIRTLALAAGRGVATTYAHLETLQAHGLVDWRLGAAATLKPTVRLTTTWAA